MAENRAALADLNGQWIDRFHDCNGLKYIVVDVDSSVSPTHGDKEGSAWNRHFDCNCYHPNFLFNQFGMLERCALRHGNVHSADNWRDVLDPVIARYAGRDLGARFFRADDGARHPRLHPTIASATVMRVAAIQAQTERKRQDRSVRRAEKRRRQARMLRFRGPIHPVPAVCATADAARGERSLSSGQTQAILTSDDRLLGECRLISVCDGFAEPHTLIFPEVVVRNRQHSQALFHYGRGQTDMSTPAPILAPAARTYRGGITRPERWATWVPNKGDILVCTPSKCGTTWTQTMLAMLVHGGADLPAKLPVLSPWVDADLGVSASDVAAALDAQTGRRVVKTHTPADGFPIWDGVTVISIYRHPLDVFFSLHKHVANRTNPGADNPMNQPVSQAIHGYINDPSNNTDDDDNLASLATHYSQTVLSGRLPDLKVFHYSDMIRDGRRAVRALAKAAGIDADDRVIDVVTKATAFGAMRAKAADYAPVSGTGFWKAEENFFDSGSSRKWEGQLSSEEFTLYSERLAELIPEACARDWLEHGDE